MKLWAVLVLLTGCAASKSNVAPAADSAGQEAQSFDTFDRDALARFVQSHVGEVQSCYQKELETDPALHGTIVFEFTLSSTGVASEIAIAEDTLNNAKLARCLTTLVGSWKFPFKFAEEVTVAYPFVFSAKPD
jgi:hypothetical protein